MQQKRFRNVALEPLSVPEKLDDTMQIATPLGSLGWVSLVVVIGAVICIMVGRAKIKLPGQGILIHPGGMLDVVSPAGGPLAAVLVRRRSLVSEGDAFERIPPQLLF